MAKHYNQEGGESVIPSFMDEIAVIMNTFENTCVGCGITYTHLGLARTLYCSDNCKNTHSLLEKNKEKEESTDNHHINSQGLFD